MRRLLIPIFLSNLLLADCTPSQEQRAKSLWRESFQLDGIQKIERLEEAMRSCSLLEIEVELSIATIKEQLNGDNLSLELIDELNIDISDTKSKNATLFIGDIRTQNADRLKALTDKSVSIQSKIETNQEKLKELQAYREDKGTKRAFGSGERLLLPVLFANGKARVRESSKIRNLISRIKATLREDREAQFSITGYASSRGRANGKRGNQKLSEKRAKNTQIYIERYIPKGHIYSSGKGESDLICNSGYSVALGGGEYHCQGGTENEASSRRIEVFRRR